MNKVLHCCKGYFYFLERQVFYVKNELLKTSNWVAGVQWLFFIFANIVIIPITVGAAFDLSQEKITAMLQLSFVITGVACIAQAFLGHRRAIMEGQSGLWWGIILTLVVTTSAQDMPLEVLGGSLAIGIFISAVLTIIIGIAGLGPYLSKLFSPGVMGVFMFLFGCQLIQIFLKGMFGLPFGNSSGSESINLPISLLGVIIAIIVIIFNIKAPARIRSYGLLMGIIVGWIAYVLIFGSESAGQNSSFEVYLFPLGTPVWNTGVIITAVLAGLLNTANTFGALKGTDNMYDTQTTKKQYRSSFTITGIFTGLSGLFGLVPYAPFVSSIGFLKQTGILKSLPFILGGIMFFLMGVIPPVGNFFSTIPLSIGSAVLFVAYLQLLNSSWDFFREIQFNTLNVYRSAIPLFVGIIIMTLPASAFESIPSSIRPVVSSGLLVGIILSLVLENMFNWEEIGEKSSSEKTLKQQKKHNDV